MQDIPQRMTMNEDIPCQLDQAKSCTSPLLEFNKDDGDSSNAEGLPDRPVTSPSASPIDGEAVAGRWKPSDFEKVLKKHHVDAETAFTPQADTNERKKHSEKLRHELTKVTKRIAERIKAIGKKGLPLRFPGEDDFLKRITPGLVKLQERLKPHPGYHCLPVDSTAASNTGPGDFFFHLLVRQPELLKECFMDTFLLADALSIYLETSWGGDEIFRHIKSIVEMAKRLQTHLAKLDLETQQQKLSFCAYQLVYATKLGVSLVPESRHAINFAMIQARTADPNLKTDDFFKMLRGYVLQGVLQKRKQKEKHVVVDVVQRLEEDLATRLGVKVKIVV